MKSKRNRLWLIPVTLALALPLLAQQQTQPQKDVPDETGFVSIFDGKSLDGWTGDTKYWRAEGGSLVGEITPGNQIQENTFIIYRGGPDKGLMKDFELKLDYKVTDRGNSGINYRSSVVEGKPFVLKGYQFDIDGPLKNNGTTRHTGNNYDEKGRTFMALRGQVGRATEGGKRQVIGTLGDYTEMTKIIKNDDWNTVHLIVRGNTLIHMLNGQVVSILVDDDAAGRAMEGFLGVQVHVGPPMKIEYRNIRMKKLESTPTIRVGMSKTEFDVAARLSNGVDVTPGMAIIGPRGEWPLHGIYWEFKEYKSVIAVSFDPANQLGSLHYLPSECYAESKGHRAEVERKIDAITLHDGGAISLERTIPR